MLRLYGDEDGLGGDGYPDIGDRNPYNALARSGEREAEPFGDGGA
jgi:hypothetical protein